MIKYDKVTSNIRISITRKNKDYLAVCWGFLGQGLLGLGLGRA